MKKLFNLLLIGVFLIPLSVHGALIDDLVSWWAFEEESGARVDSHGVNDLTDNNTVLFGTGIVGNGADFETSNSEYLTINDGSQTGLDITGDLTMATWVKFESVVTTFLFHKGYEANTDRAYDFVFDANTLSVQTSNDGNGGGFLLCFLDT